MDQQDSNRDKWIKIHTIESVFELDMIRDALDGEGIEYQIKEYKDTAYDGLFILQKGYARLSVKERNEDAARKIVEEIKSLPYVAPPKD
jgi:ketol-acid reductoisomerase